MDDGKQPEDYKTYRRSRSVRLENSAYCLPDTCYFVTACCQDRQRYFDDPGTATMTFETWMEVLQARTFHVWALCVMPDHLHALVQSGQGGSPLGRSIGAAKVLTLQRVTSQKLVWQPKYYDRVLRQSESAAAIGRYIANNPVRAGLANSWQDWQWTHLDGSI